MLEFKLKCKDKKLLSWSEVNVLRLGAWSRGEGVVRGLVTGTVALLGCFALTFVIGSAFLLPSSSDAVETELNISVASVLELEMNASGFVVTASTPTSGGAMTYGADIVATVSTNNATGYTLSMSAKTEDDVDLRHTNLTDAVSNSANTSAAALAVNTWGYNLRSGAVPTTFLRIPAPTLPDVLAVTDAPSQDSATTMTTALDVNTSVPAGTYNSVLTFTAVGNYVPDPPIAMQTITPASCPTDRTLAYDVRDGNTYWVQELADGKCWMLTNLAYAGGGTNTYGDVKSISNGEAVPEVFTTPYYYVPAGSNVTSGTANPSVSTDGGVTSPQYGYLYNWCAAMGAQSAACNDTTTSGVDSTISVCPAGWTLSTNDELGALSVFGSPQPSNTSDLSAAEWVPALSGLYDSAFINGGGDPFEPVYALGLPPTVSIAAYYWSSTISSPTEAYSYILGFDSSGNRHYSGLSVDRPKDTGAAVRCVIAP